MKILIDIDGVLADQVVGGIVWCVRQIVRGMR